jgi:ribose transport system substrate-binding protein
VRANAVTRKSKLFKEEQASMSRKHQYTRRRGIRSLVVAAAITVVSASVAIAASGAKTLRIAGVVAQTPDPYFVSMKCGALAAAKKMGRVTLTWQGPVQPSVPQQITALGSVAVTKPDGVILTPFSPTAFLQPVTKLMKQGVPVALTDAYLSHKAAYSATYTDVSSSGPVLAQRIAGLVGGKGELGIVAFGAGDPFETPRYAGMVKVIKAKYPNITVLPVQYAAADSNKAAQVVSGLLAAHPNLKAIYATDGPMGQGAAAALRTAGKRGVVKLISFDAEPALVNSLRNGSIDALYAQAPYIEGYNAMRSLVNYLRGPGASKKPVKPASRYYTPSPLKFITKADLAKPETRKFLYLASC